MAIIEVSGVEKVTFVVSTDTMDILRGLSRKLNKPLGEVLRDSIALEKWYEDVRESRGRIIVEKDGRMQELRSV